MPTPRFPGTQYYFVIISLHGGDRCWLTTVSNALTPCHHGEGFAGANFGCSACARHGRLRARAPLLSGLLIGMFHTDYYFPSSMSFFQIPDSIRNLAQWVTSVNDGCDLFGFNQLL